LALFEKAAARGHVGAMFAMGAMHGGGHEVPTDRAAAQHWFHEAAERGHAYAQMMLGRYLARGLAGERDFDRARVWSERALAQGLQEARADLATLPPTETERAEPQAAAR
jgi:TPR repeat protein